MSENRGWYWILVAGRRYCCLNYERCILYWTEVLDVMEFMFMLHFCLETSNVTWIIVDRYIYAIIATKYLCINISLFTMHGLIKFQSRYLFTTYDARIIIVDSYSGYVEKQMKRCAYENTIVFMWWYNFGNVVSWLFYPSRGHLFLKIFSCPLFLVRKTYCWYTYCDFF